MLQGSGPPGLYLKNPAILVRNKGTPKSCALLPGSLLVLRLSSARETLSDWRNKRSSITISADGLSCWRKQWQLRPAISFIPENQNNVSEQLLWSVIVIKYAMYYLGFSQKEFPVLVQHVFDSFKQNDWNALKLLVHCTKNEIFSCLFHWVHYRTSS